MSKEEIPLHEIVLDILYQENSTQPQLMSTEDILWKIGNPEIAIYHVKAVLEWLEARKDVEYRFSKYQLTKITFLELKKQYASTSKKLTPYAKERRKAAQFGQKSSKKTTSKRTTKKTTKAEHVQPKIETGKNKIKANTTTAGDKDKLISKEKSITKVEQVVQQHNELKTEQKKEGLKKQLKKWWHKLNKKG